MLNKISHATKTNIGWICLHEVNKIVKNIDCGEGESGTNYFKVTEMKLGMKCSVDGQWRWLHINGSILNVPELFKW